MLRLHKVHIRPKYPLMGRSGIYLAIFCMFLIKSSVFREHNSSQLQNLSTVRYLCAWQFPNTLSILTNSESTVALKKADNFQEMLCKSQTFVPVSLLGDFQEALIFVDDGSDDKTHCGIGCRFMRLDMAFWYAYSNHMSLHSLVRGDWEYTSAVDCPSRNHECYFQPIASAPIKEFVSDRRSVEMLLSYDSKKLKDNEQYLEARLWTRKSLDFLRKDFGFGIPALKEDLLLEKKTGCWLAAQILYFLLKPNTILENEVRKAKEKLNWNRDSGKCVAVHVRHGWRSRFSADLSMTEYVMSVRRLSHVKKILLITEDDKVISDALSNFPEYDWLYTEYPRENSHDIGIAMSEGKIDPTAEALNALVNLILSSECQYFVGQVNSTWYRLMIMLAYGKYGQMPPFDNIREDWGHGGLRKWGFFGMCTLEELQKEVAELKRRFPELVKMDPSKIK